MARPRGRPPAGEYADKKLVANFRIRPDTSRLLAAAARKSGRSVSQETEHQLRRALVDRGGPTHAVIGAISAAIDGLLAGQPAGEQWLKDPRAFDQVASAFSSALEMFRPAGDVVLIERDLERHGAQARKELLSLLAQAATVDASAPLEKQTPRIRLLAYFRNDLGDLIARPAIHGTLHAIGPKSRCPHCNGSLAAPASAKEESAS
jgi:hypothetical protein